MHILYVDIDSLRPDHIGAYGYDAPTTPNIDALATDAIIFDRAYAANSPCMPSRAAFLTGRYGIHNGIATHGSRSLVTNSPASKDDFTGDSEDWWTVPELFFNNQIVTGAVSSFPRHRSPWFYHLWHEYYQPQEPNKPGESFQTPRAETVVKLASRFIQEHQNDDFFLYAQFWDPHGPYNRSDDEVDRFRDVPLSPFPTNEQIKTHLERDRWRSPTDPELGRSIRYASSDAIVDRDALNELVSHYDAEIRYADEQIGQLMNVLKDTGLYQHTLIIVTADHGEEFGEHALYREHWSTHDGTQRIPLLIKPPVQSEYKIGHRNELVTNVDMAPTVAEYANFEMPDAWQGQSLWPLLDEQHKNWRDYIVIEHGLYTAQRAVRTDRWKYIRTFNPGLWEDVAPPTQLYDMDVDPWEQHNVASEHPEIIDTLDTRMIRWEEQHCHNGEDPLRKVAREGPTGAVQWASS